MSRKSCPPSQTYSAQYPANRRPCNAPSGRTIRRPPQRQTTPERAADRAPARTPCTGKRSFEAQAKKRRRRRRRRRNLRLLLLISVLLFIVRCGVYGVQSLAEAIRPPKEPEPQKEVELLLQNPDLPNGCEITSLAMVLTAQGCPADKNALYDCLPRREFSYEGSERLGPDPERYYAGDAASERGGWYCFEGPVMQAGECWLRQQDSGLAVKKLTGLSQEELEAFAREGHPVAVWVTRGYEPPRHGDFYWITPNGEKYRPYTNLHCVVLAGIEQGKYKIADPIEGWQKIDPDRFWSSFDAMGRRAVTVE